MAQKIQILFIDDIDGGEAEGTVRFALDGTEYEIDLSVYLGVATVNVAPDSMRGRKQHAEQFIALP